jgi:hypothetical protein
MDRIDQAAALHRQAAAVVEAAVQALDDHVPLPRTDLGEQQDLAARLRGCAVRLAPGWLGESLSSKDPGPLGEHRRPQFVRIGSAEPAQESDFPAIVPLLGSGHLTFSADSRDPRVAGVLRSVLLRLLATAPAGTLIVRAVDAVGGALFAPFGPLADAGLMPPAVTDRPGLQTILAEAEHWVKPSRPVDQRKPTARPRRRDCTMLLIIAALPSTTTADDLHRITALAEAGPAAGLHLIIAGWPPLPLGAKPAMPALATSTQVALRTAHCLLGGNSFSTGTKPNAPSPTEVWTGLSIPVQLDPDPPTAQVQRVCGELAERFAAQGQVHLMDLLPDPDQWWAESSAEGLSTTVGLAGDLPVSLHFTDLTPHWLVGGRAGAGKTAFLINVLYGLCTRYDPEELHLYLLDFSANGALGQFTPTEDDPSWLPHAIEAGVDSDPANGLAMLQSLSRELKRRLAILNDAGVTRFSQLRASGAPLARIVCVIDEFQHLLSSGDEAMTLLDEISRSGRTTGIHLVMCSKSARSSSIVGQFLVRVALPGGGGVLEANNDSAATLPLGKAVVNTAGGLGGPRGATRGHEKTVRFPDPHGDIQVTSALRQRLWQAREPASAPPLIYAGSVPMPRPPMPVAEEVSTHE